MFFSNNSNKLIKKILNQNIILDNDSDKIEFGIIMITEIKKIFSKKEMISTLKIFLSTFKENEKFLIDYNIKDIIDDLYNYIDYNIEVNKKRIKEYLNFLLQMLKKYEEENNQWRSAIIIN